MEYAQAERIPLRNHPHLNEKWVQERIFDDPAILGLGDVFLRDAERIQPGAGRLDLLLQHQDTDRRYAVELQLGATDPSHIIRTIEYWDIERKRYPQYDHCAVLVAEDVTSRFLNVVSLFNGAIPLIAIQLQAVKVGGHIALVFTTVLDELVRGEEDEEIGPPADRAYWEKRGSKATVALADHLLGIVRDFAPRAALKYSKSYISFSENGRTNSRIRLRPRKKQLKLGVHLKPSPEIDQRLEQTGLDFERSRHSYDFLIRNKAEVENHRDALKELMRTAYESKNTTSA